MSMTRITVHFSRWAILLAVLAGGCTNDYGGRQEVKGTIKLNGVALDQGVIDFTPLEGQPTKQGALIANGAYHIPRSSGLMKGKYRVIITSGDGRTKEGSDEPPGPTGANIISKERIPPEYNSKTKQEIDVSDSKANVFNYDIP
jgi:hypothetical protein